MTTENTTPNTQSNEGDTTDNTVANSNKQAIEKAKESQGTLDLKISAQEDIKLDYSVKTSDKDQFLIGVTEFSGDDNPLSISLKTLANIIDSDASFGNSLASATVTLN